VVAEDRLLVQTKLVAWVSPTNHRCKRFNLMKIKGESSNRKIIVNFNGKRFIVAAFARAIAT
jgi:hypothetical protein